MSVINLVILISFFAFAAKKFGVKDETHLVSVQDGRIFIAVC